MNGEIRVQYSPCSKTKTTEDSVVYNGYGIEAHSCLASLCRVDDITCAEEEVVKLASKLNYYGLSILHLRDVVDDFLCF